MCWRRPSILNRFADDTNFEDAVNILQGSANMQRALDKVKEGASRNFLSLSVKKGKVLCLEWTGTGWGLTG